MTALFSHFTLVFRGCDGLITFDSSQQQARNLFGHRGISLSRAKRAKKHVLWAVAVFGFFPFRWNARLFVMGFFNLVDADIATCRYVRLRGAHTHTQNIFVGFSLLFS